MKYLTKFNFFVILSLYIINFQVNNTFAQPLPKVCMPFNGNAVDISGNNHDGYVDGATLTSDRFGNPNSAFDFDGVDDHIQLIDPIDALFSGNDLSITFWARTESTGNNSPVLLVPNSNTDRLNIHIHYNNNGILSTFWDYGNLAGNGRLYIPNTPFQTSWEFYAVVVSQSLDSMYIYKDGVLQASKLHTSVLIDRSRHLNIGGGISDVTNCHFHGQIDDVQIFDVALTASQVYDNFINSNSCLSSTGLSQNQNNSTIKIYPNPVSDVVRISGIEAGTYSLYLVDSKGALIKSAEKVKSNWNELYLDTHGVHPGIYILKINSELTTITKKLILK